MKYNVHEHGYEFDDYGREIEYDRDVEKEAKEIFYKPHNYSDAETGYYLYRCPKEEAERIVQEYASKREHMFSPYATAYPVYGGYIIVVTEPYDD